MIFVTGGTGLIGSHLLFQLADKGYQVRALRRKTSNISILDRIFSYYSDNPRELLKRISWCEADILDKKSLGKAFEGIEQVYHCAALVSFNPADDRYILESNVKCTRNIVELCMESDVEKLCHLSSVAAFGRNPDAREVHINEDTPWEDSANLSAYARSKYLSEQEVWKGIEKGLNAVIVNPSIVFGPGEWSRSSSKMFDTIWKGLKYCTDGLNTFVDVRDVARAMITLMESDISGERFAVTSESMPFREVFNLIADNLNKKRPRIKVTSFMGEIAWRISILYGIITGSPPLISKDTARSGQKRIFISSEKIRKRLNFEFIPVEQSIKDTCRLFLKEHG
jgi:dihydroflavonol-4-reductase